MLLQVICSAFWRSPHRVFCRGSVGLEGLLGKLMRCGNFTSCKAEPGVLEMMGIILKQARLVVVHSYRPPLPWVKKSWALGPKLFPCWNDRVGTGWTNTVLNPWKPGENPPLHQHDMVHHGMPWACPRAIFQVFFWRDSMWDLSAPCLLEASCHTRRRARWRWVWRRVRQGRVWRWWISSSDAGQQGMTRCWSGWRMFKATYGGFQNAGAQNGWL